MYLVKVRTPVNPSWADPPVATKAEPYPPPPPHAPHTKYSVTFICSIVSVWRKTERGEESQGKRPEGGGEVGRIDREGEGWSGAFHKTFNRLM